MASDRPTGRAHGWLKSAAGRAAGSGLRTRKSLIRLDFIEHKSERSVMPQDTGVGRNVVLDGLDFASLRRVWEQTFGAAPPSSLSRVFMRRVLTYERQCRTYGGLSAATRRALAAMGRCCTARSKSLTSLCRLQSHPAQYVSGIPSAAILLSISHPIRCSTRCLANVRARISGPMIAL